MICFDGQSNLARFSILIFIAYLGGKSAGRKEAELNQIKKQMGESDETDQIISNNNNLNPDFIDSWLCSRSKK